MNGTTIAFIILLILIAGWVGATVTLGYAGLITGALIMVGLISGLIILFAKG